MVPAYNVCNGNQSNESWLTAQDTHGLLRHQRDVLAVFRDIEFRNRLVVELVMASQFLRSDKQVENTTYVDSASQRIIEPFNQLNTEISLVSNIEPISSANQGDTHVVLFPHPLAPTSAM